MPAVSTRDDDFARSERAAALARLDEQLVKGTHRGQKKEAQIQSATTKSKAAFRRLGVAGPRRDSLPRARFAPDSGKA